MQYGLGRIPSPPDSRDWPVDKLKALIAAGTAKPIDRKVPSILNQGSNGTCVSAGILGLLNCAHGKARFRNKDIVPFFLTISGHGALPDGGADVRQGLLAAEKAGYISGFSRLTTQAEIDDWLQNYGPVVYGTDWLDGMDNPDATGLVKAIGNVRGGHCYYGFGDNDLGLDSLGIDDDQANSWTAKWGFKGKFRMLKTDMTKLQASGGEAWAVVVPVTTGAKESVWARAWQKIINWI
jgi:hypothetical protein